MPEAQMETPTEDTPTNAAAAAPPPEAEKDPSDLGRLTPEEQGALVKIKQDSAQYLAKIGEFEVMKARILGKLDQMDKEGQSIMDSISKRLGLNPGQQWAAQLDGTIRLVTPPGPGQAQQAPVQAKSAPVSEEAEKPTA
jgi:hypothetical protein